MRRSGLCVRNYAHACARKLKDKFDRVLCEQCQLAGYHGGKHKCGLRSVTHSTNMSSQACGKPRPCIDKPALALDRPRPHNHYFGYNYAKWRNHFVRSPQYTADATPLTAAARGCKQKTVSPSFCYPASCTDMPWQATPLQT